MSEDNIICFDTEDDSKGNFLCACFYDGKSIEIYYTKDDCLAYIRNKMGYIFWAHNLDYDLNNIYSEKLVFLQRNYAGGRIIFATDLRNNVKFYDSFNHTFSSLDAMSKFTELEKIPYDFQGKINLKKLTEHCVRDTEILYYCIKELRDFYLTYNVEMRATVASNALAIFIKNYSDKEYILGSTKYDKETLKLAYFGGRVECFDFNYHRKVYKYDFNSLYPFVMLNDFPDIFSLNNKKCNIDNFEGCAYVKVKIFDSYYGVLPYRDINNKVIFPIGIFQGWYSYIELRYIIDNKLGVILEIFDYIQFSKSDKVFYNYVISLYKEKQNSIGLRREFVKRLLVSLYGKFAEIRQPQIMTYISNVKDHSKIKYTYPDGICYLEFNLGYARHSNMIWSIYVTSYGRILLDQYIRKYHSLYSDTDSIFTIDPLPNNLVSQNELGKLKLEGIAQARFYGNKIYRFGKDWICKGIPKDQAKNAIQLGRAEFRKPIKYKESLRRKDKLKANIWITMSKEINLDYDKRIVKKDGLSIPICLGASEKSERKGKKENGKNDA